MPAGLGKELKGRRIVLWPVNIDSSATISMGRKIGKSRAVWKPSVKEIVEAASSLGLNPEVEESAYPRLWWAERARIVVDKVGPKRRVLEMIASRIAEARSKKRG